VINFPTLYQDELLYSCFARYHRDTGNEDTKDTMYDLFGNRNVCTTVFFPSHLDALCTRMPVPYIYSVDELISDHTLLPYFIPFIPLQRFFEIKQLLKEGSGASVFMRLGIPASTLKHLQYFRFCRECIEEELNQFGEAYWHRTHQLEGVFVCPKHSTELQVSDLPLTNQSNKHAYLPLDPVVFGKSINKHTEIYCDHEIKKFISNQTLWLLSNSIEPFGLNQIQNYYKVKLRQMGYTSFSGNIKWVDLLEAFLKCHGKELLLELNSFIEDYEEDTWIHRVLRKPRVTCHPLRHLLLLYFMGETVESMVQEIHSKSYKHFGEGPWPCLNKAAEHYGEKLISHCPVHRCSDTGKPVGTFECSCGFVYIRKGPDETEVNVNNLGRIKCYGHVWEQRLLELNKTNLSLRGKAKILGCDPRTVLKKSSVKSAEFQQKNKYEDEVMHVYKKKWLDLIEENNGKNISYYRSKAPEVYSWLNKYNIEWLKKQNYISCKSKGNNRSRSDWEFRDKELSQEVDKIAGSISKEKENLVRVTRNEIGRKLGKLSLLNNRLNLMPLTKTKLNSVTETIKDFQIRRIRIRAMHLRRTQGSFKQWELVRAAGLKSKLESEIKTCIYSEVVKIDDLTI
jgi:hypothetical protein